MLYYYRVVSRDSAGNSTASAEYGPVVAIDNSGATWRAYNNRYWPSLYLIDKRGNIRYQHIGEGQYQETEQAIQSLLAETYP